MKYLVDGEEVYKAATASHPVRSGQILIAPAGQPFEVELRRPSAGLCLYFDAPETSGRFIPTLRLNAAEFDLGRRIASLAESAMRSGEGMDDRIRLFLLEMRGAVDTTLDDLEDVHCRVGGIKTETRRQRVERMTQSRMYLEHHAHRPVSLEQAARAAGMSLFHFARQFAQIFGETPAAFHERLRLEHASKRLMEGVSASAVARELGYSELSTFSRAYSRRFGVPPSRVARLSCTLPGQN